MKVMLFAGVLNETARYTQGSFGMLEGQPKRLQILE